MLELLADVASAPQTEVSASANFDEVLPGVRESRFDECSFSLPFSVVLPLSCSLSVLFLTSFSVRLGEVGVDIEVFDDDRSFPARTTSGTSRNDEDPFVEGRL